MTQDYYDAVEEEDIYSSPLFQELLNHCVKQHDCGVPLEEIFKFLENLDSVREFFESQGYYHDESGVDGDDVDDAQSEFGEESESCNNVIKDEEDAKDNNVNNLSRAPSQQTEEAGPGTESDLGDIGKIVCVDGINKSWQFPKLIKFTIYVLLFVLVSLVGHIGICYYVLDVNPLKWFPTLQEKRCLIPAHPILMEMTRPIADCGFCSTKDEGGGDGDQSGGHSIVIEMEGIPSMEEFSKVAYLSKPVIIRGGGKSGGMPEGFDFPQLKQIFQSEPGGVDAVSEECQFLQFRSPFTSLREAFHGISENSSWDEPWYIGWSNCHPGVAAKLRELFPRPSFLPEGSSSSAIDWIFIGSPGLGASMHIDYVKRPSWQAQLSGIKRWILHPPPECESVCPESLTFTIYPGDLLFLETNTWYHETFIDSNSLSISIGSEYD